jgi:hypothetical protein
VFRALRATVVTTSLYTMTCPAALFAQGGGRGAAPPRTPLATPMAHIVGSAFDSVAMRPLDGALIQLVSASDPTQLKSATANARGAFTIDSVRVGTYLLGFLHPKLDSLGIEAPLLRVDVQTSGEILAAVAIPSSNTLIARACGPTAASEAVTLFTGTVRTANGAPLAAPARVRTQWTEISVGATGIDRRTPSRVITTSATGAFAICGVPATGGFMARAFSGSDSSGTIELETPKNRLLNRDIVIGASIRVAGKASATGPSSTLKGSGVLRGIARSPNGQPIRGARVSLWGSGRTDSTNASGQFSMQAVPTGTYTIEARALGYYPRRMAVDIPEVGEGLADLALDVFVPTIDTMRVRANRNGLDPYAEFEKRRKSSMGGYFIDEAQLNKRTPMFMSDLVRAVPGISITPAELNGDRVLMRGSAGSGSCVPTVFLNGLRVFSENGVLDDVVNPQDVRGVEIYSRAGSTPPQFTSFNGCGSIVIWTGARRPTGQP